MIFIYLKASPEFRLSNSTPITLCNEFSLPLGPGAMYLPTALLSALFVLQAAATEDSRAVVADHHREVGGEGFIHPG